jgi:GntR family transcriptional regulator
MLRKVQTTVLKFQPETSEAVHALDKTGFIPLYYQIQQTLMEKIRSGQLNEGDPLASEEELARLHQVSRMTARQALHGLKSSGYAVSRKGRGTFVTRPKMENNILHLQGFTEDMKQRGMVPSSHMLEHVVIGATEAIAEKLNINEGDSILRLRRLRYADGTPMAIEESHLPLRLYPGLDRYDLEKDSLYGVLRDNYGVTVAWADEIIEAAPATREESELLTIPKRASVLSISRVIMSTADMPIEAACSRYRGDRYRASIRVPAVSAK